MGDRLVIRPSRFATTTGADTDLVQFAIVGPRGAIKAEDTVERREAQRRYDRLGALLGRPAVFPTSRAEGCPVCGATGDAPCSDGDIDGVRQPRDPHPPRDATPRAEGGTS